MNKYDSWNLNKARKQLTYLTNRNMNGTNNFDIEIIKQVIDDTIIPWDVGLSLREKLLYDKKKLNEYSYFLNSIKNLADSELIKHDDLASISIEPSELLLYVYEFFNKNMPEWMDIFKKVYKERKNNFRFTDTRGYELYIPKLDYNYITSLRTGTIEDIFSCIHEYTHTIIDRLKNRSYFEGNYPFIELPSITMELIAGDDIIDTFFDLDKEVNIYLAISINTYILLARDIMDAVLYLKLTDLDDEEKIEYTIKSYACGKVLREHNLTDKLQLENIFYVVSFINAVELYYLYNGDSDLFNHTMDERIHMGRSKNYEKKMLKLGVNPNQHMSEFINKMRRVN